MASEIKLRNPETGQEAVAYRGYSWTSLCFGGIPALLRGDYLAGALVMMATLGLGLLILAQGLQPWIASAVVGVVWGYFYNEVHLQRKLGQGFEVVAS